MALELYIDENPIELIDSGNRIGLTFQVNDFNELQNRQSNFSNQFKVPKTRLNRKYLENIDNVNSNTNIPYRKGEAKIIQDGLEVVPNGYAIIESSDDFYNIIVYSGNLDFFDLIEGLSIRDLDFTDVYHDWNFTNVFGSRSNTSGYIYPIINWGNLNNTAREVNPRLMHPALFDFEIVEKIFNEKGYSIDGDFLSNAFYRKMLTPCTDYNYKYSKNFIHNREFKAQQVGTKTVTVTISKVSSAFIHLNLLNEIYDYGSKFNDYTYSPNTNFTSNFTGTVTVTLNGTAKMQMLMAKNGSLPLSPSNTYAAGTHVLTIVGIGSGSTTDFSQGDYVEAGVFVQGTSGTPVTITFTLSNGELYNEPHKELYYGNTWDFESTLPDIKQKDFVKKIFNQFAIIPVTDSVSKTVYFRQVSELYDNIKNAPDWSNKLHDNVSLSISYHANNYAQTNSLLYKKDDNVTDGLGDGSFAIDDEFLPLKKNVVELPVAASDMEKMLIDLDVPEIARVDMNTPDPFNTALNGKFVTKVEPRNLVLDTQNITGGDLVYDDDSTSNQSSNNIPLCYFKLNSKADNLAFDNNLIDNYESIETILNDYKKISCYMKLDAIDIAGLDFLTPIYLGIHSNKNQINGHFYLNKIENYKQGSLTKTDLIKL